MNVIDGQAVQIICFSLIFYSLTIDNILNIIVLLILAGVTIAMLTGDNSIITNSKKAKTVTEIAEIKERVEIDVLEWQSGSRREEISNVELKAILDKYFNEVPKDYYKDTEITAKDEYGGHTIKVSDVYDDKIPISKDTSFVGCYADIDDDGTIDGIIYADLAMGNTGSGQWGNSNGIYTIPKTEGLKEYYISQKEYKYNDGFGTKEVISPNGTGKGRFYVMALEDFNKGTYYDWYNAAYEQMDDYLSTTSDDFGKGKTNTTTMISKWNNKAYGEQNQCPDHKDMWGEIQTEVNKGWFVPSKAEWAAFAGELGIYQYITDSPNAKNSYSALGLTHFYFSSSQFANKHAWSAIFSSNLLAPDDVNYHRFVRLSTTF